MLINIHNTVDTVLLRILKPDDKAHQINTNMYAESIYTVMSLISAQGAYLILGPRGVVLIGDRALI